MLLLDQESLQAVAHVLVTSWLYCKMLYMGLLLKTTQKFQSIHSAAVQHGLHCLAACQSFHVKPSWHRVPLLEGPVAAIISARWLNLARLACSRFL